MTDVRSPNGGVLNGADLTATADFVTLQTVIGQTTGNFGSAASTADNLFRLSELIQQKANMKYIKVSSAVVDLSDATNRAFYQLGTDYNQALTTVYTIKFVVDQSGFVSTSIIHDLLQGIAVVFPTVGVPITGPAVRTISAYEIDSASAKNMAITITTI